MTFKTIITILIIIVSLFIVFCMILWLFQEKLIFFPQKTRPGTIKHFAHFNYTVNINNQILNGWLIRRNISPNKPLIVYFGGNAEDVSGNLFDIDHFNVNSFLFMNYRGFGDSTGKPSESALFGDAVALIEHIVKTENITLDSIIVMGRSLGTGVAIHVASLKKIRGVILISPFDSLVNIAKIHYPLFPVRLLLKHKFDSVSSAPHIQAPALFVIGSRDEIIPNKNSEAIYNKWGGQKQLVTLPGANHNNITGHRQYWDAINNFTDSLKGN